MGTLKVKRLTAGAILPTRANWNDAGLDLYANETVLIKTQSRAVIGTGIAMQIPDGLVGRIAPRSGLAVKNGIDVLAGVVDAGYRGEVKVVLLNTDKDKDYLVNVGDKIAQILIQPVELMPVVEVDDLDDAARGNNGFGSTGL